MRSRTKLRIGALTALAAGLAIGLTAAGTAAAQAQPASQAARTPVKWVTHHFALAASAFAPDGLHDTSQDYFNQWDPATLSDQDAGRCFNAGLQIPTSITLKSVTAYYTQGSGVLYFEVSRQDLVNHTAAQLLDYDTTASTGSPAYTSTTTPVPAAYAVVNMKTYAYTVGVCPTASTTFSGLVITYSQQVAG